METNVDWKIVKINGSVNINTSTVFIKLIFASIHFLSFLFIKPPILQ